MEWDTIRPAALLGALHEKPRMNTGLSWLVMPAVTLVMVVMMNYDITVVSGDRLIGCTQWNLQVANRMCNATNSDIYMGGNQERICRYYRKAMRCVKRVVRRLCGRDYAAAHLDVVPVCDDEDDEEEKVRHDKGGKKKKKNKRRRKKKKKGRRRNKGGGGAPIPPEEEDGRLLPMPPGVTRVPADTTSVSSVVSLEQLFLGFGSGQEQTPPPLTNSTSHSLILTTQLPASASPGPLTSQSTSPLSSLTSQSTQPMTSTTPETSQPPPSQSPPSQPPPSQPPTSQTPPSTTLTSSLMSDIETGPESQGINGPIHFTQSLSQQKADKNITAISSTSSSSSSSSPTTSISPVLFSVNLNPHDYNDVTIYRNSSQNLTYNVLSSSTSPTNPHLLATVLTLLSLASHMRLK